MRAADGQGRVIIAAAAGPWRELSKTLTRKSRGRFIANVSGLYNMYLL